MEVSLHINGSIQHWEIGPGDTLLSVLRCEGYFGTKFGGCTHGECGACTVLFDNRPVNSCQLLAAQAEGHPIRSRSKGWASIPTRDGEKPRGCTRCNWPSSKTALSSAGIAPRRRSWQPRLCWTRIGTPRKAKCGKPSPACCAAAPGIPNPVQAILRVAAVMRGEKVGTARKDTAPSRPGEQNGAGGANPTRKWMRSNWPRENRPLRTISKCVGCCTPKS